MGVSDAVSIKLDEEERALAIRMVEVDKKARGQVPTGSTSTAQ
jgi:hypothetical protein